MKSSTLLIMVTALSLGFSSRASKVPMKTSKTEVQKGSAPFIPQDKQWEDFKKLYSKSI